MGKYLLAFWMFSILLGSYGIAYDLRVKRTEPRLIWAIIILVGFIIFLSGAVIMYKFS